MEITVQSILQNEAQGQVTVPCDPDDTVDSLIAAFCIEKGVRRKASYVLKTKENEVLRSTCKLSVCEVEEEGTLYLTTRGTSGDVFGCDSWWVLAGVSLLIGSLGLVAISILRNLNDDNPQEYGIVIDAGSTHTEVLVYRWNGSKFNGTGLVEQIASCSNKVPLASFTANPAAAGPSIASCLDTAVASVPSSAHRATPIYLGATAGMRTANLTEPVAVQKILESVRDSIRKLPFLLERNESVRIISGREEGSYSWVTVNYLRGTFGVSMPLHSAGPAPLAYREPTIGALDLGGASTQITFEAEPEMISTIPSVYIEPLLLYGSLYHVYTDSFLCYGKSMAELRYMALLVSEKGTVEVENACAPTGSVVNWTYEQLFSTPCAQPPEAFIFPENTTFTFRGSGNNDECRLRVTQLFDLSTCSYGPGNCSWGNHYLPHVTGKFMAFSGFYYTMKYYNFSVDHHVSDRSLDAFNKAVVRLCGLSWDEVKVIPVDLPGTETYFCFDGHYLVTMLTKGYRFSDTTWNNLQFSKKIDGTSVGWAVGYMLNQTNVIAPALPVTLIELPVFISLLVLFIIFLVLSVLFALYARRKWQSHAGYGKVDGYSGV